MRSRRRCAACKHQAHQDDDVPASTMPSADCRRTFGLLSKPSVLPDTRRLSRGTPCNFPRIAVGSTWRAHMAKSGLPTVLHPRPEYAPPQPLPVRRPAILPPAVALRAMAGRPTSPRPAVGFQRRRAPHAHCYAAVVFGYPSSWPLWLGTLPQAGSLRPVHHPLVAGPARHTTWAFTGGRSPHRATPCYVVGSTFDLLFSSH